MIQNSAVEFRMITRWGWGRIIVIVLLISMIQGSFAEKASPARGAVLFVNYCSGCHSLRYVSWSTMISDLKLKPQTIVHLSAHQQMTFLDLSATWPHLGLSGVDAQAWFGKMPPDLSTTSRQRGSKWLRAYLLGFYADQARPFGVSNRMIEQVMMPNVLETLYRDVSVNPALNNSDYSFIAIIDDIVSFLDYASDPTQGVRYLIGAIVIGFLLMLCGLVLLRYF